MKYDAATTAKIIADYQAGMTPAAIALTLSCSSLGTNSSAETINIPKRSVIAKLASLGVYKKKEYLTKRGEVPISKTQHIERIATLLDVSSERLESLEKVNKAVLVLIEEALKVN